MASHTQILVIGSGVAGLSFALAAAKKFNITLLTKAEAFSGNTIYAQGGIACVWDKKDTAENHIHDTLTAGAGHCKKEAVDILVREATVAIKNLIDIAVPFCKESDNLHLGREGGHSHHRIVHVKDFTGRALMENLLHEVKNHPGITVLEHQTVTSLLTENNICYGAKVLDNASGELKTIFSDYTILCTGGAGQVFSHTTNPEEATADGIALASKAAAKLKDLEFVQFHPTTLYHPLANGFLISEALRGAGAILVHKNGKSFMEKYHWQASLAPRDIVSRAIYSELQKYKTDCVYLDARAIGEAKLKHEFPQIFKKCLELGIDISKDLIPVIPSAHYMCGGVEADVFGKTSVERLFALGEVACTGVHGANRLASNSLLEGLVFANRASKHIDDVYTRASWYRFANNANISQQIIEPVKQEILQKCDAIKCQVKEIMWSCFGIVRKRKEMLKGYKKLYRLREIERMAETHTNSRKVLETYNIWRVAIFIAKAALSRKKSLGAHYVVSNASQKNRQINIAEAHI